VRRGDVGQETRLRRSCRIRGRRTQAAWSRFSVNSSTRFSQLHRREGPDRVADYDKLLVQNLEYSIRSIDALVDTFDERAREGARTLANNIEQH
jgi:hypothetical protein